MVGRKPNLRQFLKKEVQKAKIKAPELELPRIPTISANGGRSSLTQDNLFGLGSSLGSRSPLTQNNPHHFGSPGSVSGPHSPPRSAATGGFSNANSLFGDTDVDSLFGEPLSTASVKDQELKALMKQSLAEGFSKTCTALFTESPNLKDIRAELKILIVAESEGQLTDREWYLLERQMEPLKEEIRYMEQVERKAFEENRAMKIKNLPDPIGHSEKIRIEREKQRLERSKAQSDGATSKKRRRREDRNNDNDLDGEDRLRLGMRIKAKPLTPTGHFKSTIHSYFPGLPGAKEVVMESGAEVLLERTLRDYDSEERKLRRRELAELGEALAKVDRRMKRG